MPGVYVSAGTDSQAESSGPFSGRPSVGGLLALACAVASLGVSDAAAVAPAPDPGGSETADVQLPPNDGRYFGFNQGGGRVDEVHPGPDYAAMIARAGGNIVRLTLPWRDLERTRDWWHRGKWDRYAGIYEAMLARGITPLFTLYAAPTWARDLQYRDCTNQKDKACIYPPAQTPEMLGEWQQFARQVSARFPRAVLGIWNEPNLRGSWKSGVDPARYAQLVAYAYAAVKEANPQQTVIAGGLATKIIEEPSPHMSFQTFLAGAYAASPSLAGNVDGVDFHPYPGKPNAVLGAGGRWARLWLDMRNLKQQYGDSTPIWATEFGLTTTGSNPATEATQADMILRGVRRMLTMDDVAAAIVHTLDEDASKAQSSAEWGFGVLRAATEVPLPPKPAYCALVAESDLLHPLCPGALAPETSIGSAPAAIIGVAQATFAFSSDEEWTHFECSLDGSAWSRCESPTHLDELTHGQHRFRVRAVDAGGRLDPSAAEHSFAVDLPVPWTRIDSGPADPTNDPSPSFTYSSSHPGASFECRFADGNWYPCDGPGEDLGPLTDGRYTFEVRATDPDGDTDPTPATRTFTVDLRPPETRIDSGASGTTQERSPTFRFSSDDPAATFECRIDVGTWKSCVSGQRFGPLPLGEHTFEVRAVDRATNKDPTPAKRTFTVVSGGILPGL